MILYAGTYTEMITKTFGGHGDGILCYDFKPETGSLELLHTIFLRNPSYLCLHPEKKYLYAVEEVLQERSPVVHAFSIQNDYSLKFINKQPIPGGLPCHIEMTGKDTLAIACYETGHVTVYPISEDGSLEEASFVRQHQGSSSNQERQESAHAHIIALESPGKIAVCDLGMDEILFYQSDDRILKESHRVKMPLGHGPRHIAFHPGGQYAFVINELTATVSLLKKIAEQWAVQATLPALPDTYSGEPAGSAIRVHPSGRVVYSGNRGHDSIAIFHFNEKDGSFKLAGHQLTGGQTPREFNLSPDGQWLLAAHQDSDSIVVFKVDTNDGSLTKTGEYPINSPVCLRWLE